MSPAYVVFIFLSAFKPKFAEPQRPRAERDMDEMYYTAAPDWRGKGK